MSRKFHIILRKILNKRNFVPNPKTPPKQRVTDFQRRSYFITSVQTEDFGVTEVQKILRLIVNAESQNRRFGVSQRRMYPQYRCTTFSIKVFFIAGGFRRLDNPLPRVFSLHNKKSLIILPEDPRLAIRMRQLFPQ